MLHLLKDTRIVVMAGILVIAAAVAVSANPAYASGCGANYCSDAGCGTTIPEGWECSGGCTVNQCQDTWPACFRECTCYGCTPILPEP
jgi:hypothetical protein